MQRTDQIIVVLTKDMRTPEQEIRANILRLFSLSGSESEVVVLRYSAGRMHALNAWFARCSIKAQRIIVLDADRIPLDSVIAFTQYIAAHSADAFFCCGPAPKQTAFRAKRNRFIRFICENAVIVCLNERVLQRIQTADTTDLVQEALTDNRISVAFVPKETVGSSTRSDFLLRIRRIVCFVDARWMMVAFAAAALSAFIIFFALFLHTRSASLLIACIICAHLFLFLIGALLVRWYHASIKREQMKREHSYVEEMLAK